MTKPKTDKSLSEILVEQEIQRLEENEAEITRLKKQMKPKTDNTSMGNPPTGTYFEKPKPQTKGWEEKIRTDYKNIYSKEYIDETVKYWGKIVSQAHQQGYREAVEKAKQLTINLIEESYKRGREDEAIECQKDMERVVEEKEKEIKKAYEIKCR